MPRVYIETTIPSYYFETRTTATAVAWRKATREWWAQASTFELVTSRFVLNELSLAPPSKRDDCLALLRGVRVLPEPDRVALVIREYIRHALMPADDVGDAAHLAMASLHRVDFLLTWNCKHLANANKIPHIQSINRRLGLGVPILATPITLPPEGTQ